MPWKRNQHVLIKVDTYFSKYTAAHPTWQQSLREVCLCVCVCVCVCGGQQLFERIYTADNLRLRACLYSHFTHVGEVECSSFSVLRHKTACWLTGCNLQSAWEATLCPTVVELVRTRNITVVRARKNCLSNTVLPKERDERLTTVVCLTLYSPVVTICTASYSPVVTICTASLTLNNSTFCPHSVFLCFVWIWEQTAIISLYNINWLVCITESECVYCAVRTE